MNGEIMEKGELVLTKGDSLQSIIGYIGFYNTKKLHSYNGYCSPAEMELKWWRTQFGRSA